MIIHRNYDELISLENLLSCWRDFRRDKARKRDVMEFERNLEDNIFRLHNELSSGCYRHGSYSTFYVYDPKCRTISKALVRDRLVHHVVFNELYRVFDPLFIFHSYSSRLNKGSHVAIKNVANCLRKISGNYTRKVFVLKGDIQKFFWSVNHQKLFTIIQNKMKDDKFLGLVNEVICSFSSAEGPRSLNVKNNLHLGKGLPIGNVTSQIFANIYLDKLDQFIKQQLKVKSYFRYADDFIIIHRDQDYLRVTLTQIQEFLQKELMLGVHPQKVSIRKFYQGTDFLGYIILPHYTILRTKTKRRILKKIQFRKQECSQGLINRESFNQSLQSYLGILKHCRGYKIKQKILEIAKEKESQGAWESLVDMLSLK